MEKKKKKKRSTLNSTKELSTACHVDIMWVNTDKHFLRTYKKRHYVNILALQEKGEVTEFLYKLHSELTHNGSEPENLNFRDAVVSLALFYFLKCKSKDNYWSGKAM